MYADETSEKLPLLEWQPTDCEATLKASSVLSLRSILEGAVTVI